MAKKSPDKPEAGKEFLSAIAPPARRALENAGIKTPDHLSGKSETEILKLHGIGPSAIPVLRSSLKLRGLAFRK